MTAAWLAAALASGLALGPPLESGGPESGGAESETPEAGAGEAQRSPAYADELAVAPEAQRDEASSRELIDAGKTAFRDGRFEEAIEIFAEAYRLFPNVTLYYALGSAHRRAHESSGDPLHLELSVRRYKQYLSEAPDAEFASLAQNYLTAVLAERDLGSLQVEVATRILVSTTIEGATMVVDGSGSLAAPGMVNVEPGTHRVEVRAPGYRSLSRRVQVPEGTTYQVHAELEGMPGRIDVDGPKGALVRLDGRVIGKLPLADPIVSAAGEHVVTVTRNGRRPFNEDVELDRDGHAHVRVELANSTQRLTSYFIMSFGGVGIVTSAVLTGFTLDAQRRALGLDTKRLDDHLTTAEFEQYQDLVKSRDQFRGGAVLAGVSGIALAVTGVVLFAYDIPRLDATGSVARVRAAPVLGPTQAGFAATLQF